MGAGLLPTWRVGRAPAHQGLGAARDEAPVRADPTAQWRPRHMHGYPAPPPARPLDEPTAA
eukprot:CAMPEP_0204319456 /NCGR_PEP_ID=MMETSP0469-20131031/7114_1 /ASSEMBLY_ACC=CAM_ASM_000384 /TAXON_ID=2969 /ORGANISM="Oxyrrhis marina" /LENGTH=60 /DNA_ID=CAMNT_0051300639 /DNA_START=1 /DNA_END=183 /DNA_ORIENTATION=+